MLYWLMLFYSYAEYRYAKCHIIIAMQSVVGKIVMALKLVPQNFFPFPVFLPINICPTDIWSTQNEK
jgi:hypothetical protein